jgi:hypothetical protein
MSNSWATSSRRPAHVHTFRRPKPTRNQRTEPQRKKSWFNLTRGSGADAAPASPTALGGASGSGAGRSERAPLFGGPHSEEGAARSGGGLFSSLLRNKWVLVLVIYSFCSVRVVGSCCI